MYQVSYPTRLNDSNSGYSTILRPLLNKAYKQFKEKYGLRPWYGYNNAFKEFLNLDFDEQTHTLTFETEGDYLIFLIKEQDNV